MATEFITIIDCCEQHHVETSFLYELGDAGLIEITVVESQDAMNLEQLPLLEQYIRLHYDLEINTQGIESIQYLLDKVVELKNENTALKNRLRLYE